MNNHYDIPTLPLPYDLESKAILKQVNESNKKVAELKGIAKTIPNENILISCLTLQEAKDSSAVENIVTTQDNLYKAGLVQSPNSLDAATKEVLLYREAIMEGFHTIKNKHVLSNGTIKAVQQKLIGNNQGFRTTPGTKLISSIDGSTVYTPPQDIDEINREMDNLERFINDESLSDLDPLVKMAVIHHQFESIHPFGDGNGRTGRILNILYLVYAKVIDLPILYLSRYITHNKAEYYRLIQNIRDKNVDNLKEWQDWIMFILKGVKVTSDFTIDLVKGISSLMASYKVKLREKFGSKYSHEMLNNLFFHPYTKIGFLQNDLSISRDTASKYLNEIANLGLITKVKMGRENYYVNTQLADLFVTKGQYSDDSETIITR